MKSAKIPLCEPARLEALGRYAVLDTPREPVFDRITKLAASVFEAPIALISLLGRQHQSFKSCAGMNNPGNVDRKIAFCAHTILSDDVMIVPDTRKDPRFHDSPLVTGAPWVRFYAGAPLITPDGFRVGTLCVADRVPRLFGPKQAAELQDLAALVIEILEARRATAPLVAAIETTAFGVTICDPHQAGFPIVFANPGFAAITGYDREEILGQSCRFLQGDHTDPGLVQEMRTALADRRPFRGTVRNYRKDGTAFWNSLDINPVFDDSGALISYVGVQVDTTAQVEALEKTRQSEARLATAQRAASLGSWECHFTSEGVLDERSVLWSDETYRLVGLAPGTTVDLWEQFFRSLHPDDAPALNAAWSESLRTLQPYRIDHRLILPDGTERVVHEEAHFVFDEASGKPLRMVGIMQDITERQRAEMALLESRHFLRSILDALASHIAILDEQGRIVETNQAWRQSAPEGGCMAKPCGVGDDYLQRCVAAAGDAPEDITAVADGIRAVMRGERENFYREYPRGNGSEKQWFSLGVTRFEMEGAWRIVLAHDNVTPRKRAEEELRWKTAFLEAQVDSSPDAIIVVDHQGRLLLQSQRCIDLWEIPAHLKQVSVHQSAERMRWIVNQTTDPEGFAQTLAYVQAHPDETRHTEVALRNGVCFDLRSAPVIGKDGTRYGRIWTYRNITERKRIEESLRESEARFQHVAANVPGMVYRYVRHPDGSVALPFASRGCYQLYGLEPEELQLDARRMLDVIHPEDRAGLVLSVSASAADLSPWNWQGRIVKPDTGETRYIQGVSRPERHANGDIVWDGLIVDVTDRKQAEEARRAREVAERTNQEKSRFLSRMSHELRTPLNAILGFGQVLEFSRLQGQEAMALRYILQGGQHLLSLVDEVLDLSRAETGDLHLILTEVDADAVARECVGLLARLAEARGITCSVEDPGRPVRLRCDEQRLRQTLLNLLSNAIKYNREGGRVLVCFQQASAGRIRLNVTDTGPGISPEGLARLFVPFERLDYEHRGVEGTGLGLVVSRRIAEAMDGTVGVESEVGRGSTFYIELPLAPLQPEPAADPAPIDGSAGGDGPVREGVVVLYIEDNPSNLQVMEMLLARRRPHWRFLSAQNGHEGLEQVHREPPGLVLLDLQLPGMSGEEVLEKLRGDPATASVRVIVLSADATQPSRARLLARGADEYVSKPFQAEALLQLLDRQLVHNGAGDPNSRQDPAGR